jgi:hypothetical protein
VQFFEALLAEFVEASTDGDGVFQDVEANTAHEQVFECLDRNHLFLVFLVHRCGDRCAIIHQKARLLNHMEVGETGNFPDNKFASS